ncbi:WG repeat-containing protein [Streptomyces sp. NPDC048606]|uniref:WG repeat-containing protein n=1 Tax=Streptomyces sp. NPDC048606 TaxID=3154726 RepID=UPI0034496CFB
MTPPRPAPPAPYAVPVDGRDPFGRRWALVDGSGALIRPPDLGHVGPFHPDGRGGFVAPAADLTGRWGYLDASGRPLAAFDLDWAGPFDGEGLSRFLTAGLWGYADTAGAHVVPARFTDAQPFHHGLAVVTTEEGAGYVDPTGRLVIAPGFRAAGPFGPLGTAGVRLADGGRCGYVDREGNLVVEARFDGARPYGAGGAAPVRIDELWGLVDVRGEWIVEPSFRMLEPFDENGLAYVIGGRIGASFSGFVDSRGELVIRSANEMDRHLGCGLLKVGDGYTRGYLDATGAEAIERGYSWTEAFSRGGAAVARDDASQRWGVLRTDGSFTPCDHREPLTDDDAWVVGFDEVHGLAPFVTDDGAVVHVDRDGRDVCRVVPGEAGAAVSLRDAAGRTTWEGAAGPDTFPRAWPYLAPDADLYVDHGPSWRGDTAAVARELLARPERSFRPRSLIFDRTEDPYDIEALDEDERDDVRQGAMHRVASAFLRAEVLAEYPWLQDRAEACFEEVFETLTARLTDRYGPALPPIEAEYLRCGDGERSSTWRVGERLVVLQEYVLVGDGDVELQIWLAATRS